MMTINDDPATKPERSADRVSSLLDIYIEREHGTRDVDHEARERAISDLITDLLHLTDKYGFDRSLVLRRAAANLLAERDEAIQAAARAEIMDRITLEWPSVGADLVDGVPLRTVIERVVALQDDQADAELMPLLARLVEL